MPIYKYRAKKGPEDIKEGELEAQSEHDAIEKIHQMGYLPIRVKEFTDSGQGAVSSKRTRSGKVKFKDVAIFSRQLASLLKSGVPILDALDIISEQIESSNFKSIIVDIHNSIKEGLEFSAALNKYPRVFSNLYIAIVRTGEDTGSLDASLLRVADYRTKQEEVLSRFRMALVYPVLMGIVGVATVIFMLVFVMPRLTGIFSSMGQNLPLPTQLLIAISEGLRRWWFWIVIILTAFVLTVARFVKTKS
ncbi:MAG TPA: type II secretion system F family protein, partial [Candidatus Omnitrophica bacterium]|nr:type II secretion system F family protein [Candidatus Omnitrophota bacterium]